MRTIQLPQKKVETERIVHDSKASVFWEVSNQAHLNGGFSIHSLFLLTLIHLDQLIVEI